MTVQGDHIQQPTVFQASLPYAVGTLALGAAGLAVTVTAGTMGTAALVAGIAMTIIGAYAFFGVMATACSSRDANEFQANVWKGMATGAGAGLAETMRIIAQVVIAEAIASLFRRD